MLQVLGLPCQVCLQLVDVPIVPWGLSVHSLVLPPVVYAVLVTLVSGHRSLARARLASIVSLEHGLLSLGQSLLRLVLIVTSALGRQLWLQQIRQLVLIVLMAHGPPERALL